MSDLGRQFASGDPEEALAAIREDLFARLRKGGVSDHAIEGIRIVLQIAFRLGEIVRHIYKETPLEPPLTIRSDGGAAESDLLLQMIADATGIPLTRLVERQATALGAAILAGTAMGVLGAEAVARLRPRSRSRAHSNGVPGRR